MRLLQPVLLLTIAAACASAQTHYRPLFHFSPAKNWINDPNGLVYHNGEFHLFYQYNPFGDRWGHMSWGHAVSPDLTRWRELPLALAEENGIAIFSGSAVVDVHNTSGFGKPGQPPLIAIYTGHSKNLQTQNIAYSTDRGRTWTKYAGNPVIDINEADFRDPMVFWHEPTRRWIMVVALAKALKVRFYSSADLKAWTPLSDFGPAGATNIPNWECPSLFPMTVDGRTKWVLVIGVGGGAAAGGSGTQYFTGDFDGAAFINDNPAAQVLWIDHGADFYAAQTWSDIPPSDGRRIILAWMSNWKYADKVPTSPWRGQMSYPRTLQLRRTPEGLRLFQLPVAEIEKFRTAQSQIRNAPFSVAAARVDREWSEALDIEATFDITGSQDAGIELRKGTAHSTRIGYDTRRGVLYIDRTRSGDASFHPDFAARHEAPLRIADGKLHLRILLDRSSVEVFADDGRVTLTDLIFPEPSARKIALFNDAKRPGRVSLQISSLSVAPKD